MYKELIGYVLVRSYTRVRFSSTITYSTSGDTKSNNQLNKNTS